jgi:sigma-B regulation protein RsbU (phosphoserine phosphatase)
VGGDYYDFFSRDENDLEIIIADVSGHSVGAALIMAETRTALRAQPHPAASSSAILGSLNELLYDDLSRAELFITMFYVKYNAGAGVVSYASAGHNPPLLHRRSEGGCRELDAEGLILGVREHVAFEEKEVRLESGDVLLLYTDGIIEAKNETGELFGTGRLCATLDTLRDTDPEQAIDAILDEVMRFSGSTSFHDDVSLVIMRKM